MTKLKGLAKTLAQIQSGHGQPIEDLAAWSARMRAEAGRYRIRCRRTASDCCRKKRLTGRFLADTASSMACLSRTPAI